MDHWRRLSPPATARLPGTRPPNSGHRTARFRCASGQVGVASRGSEKSPPRAIRRRPGGSFPCLHRPDARSRPRGPHRGRRRNASSEARRRHPTRPPASRNYNSQKPMRPCAQGHTVFVPTGSPSSPRSRARKQRTRAWDNYNSQKAPRPRAPEHRAILPPQSLETKTRDLGNHTSQKQPRPAAGDYTGLSVPITPLVPLSHTHNQPKNEERGTQATALPKNNCDPARESK